MTVSTPQDVIDVSTQQAANEFVRDRAAALDRGETDVREDLKFFGSLGLLECGLDGRPLLEMVKVIEGVAGESLSAGFSLWAHRMTLEYIARAPESLRQRHSAGLGAGVTPGVTAMAAGLRQVAGLGDVPLIATRTADGIEISGPIRWASNVFPDSLIVLPARSEQDGTTYVAVISVDSPGVTVNPAPNLLALGSTGSTSLTLDRVQVGAGDIVSTDLAAFVREIRPTFLLLQTAFCSGIARTTLAEAAQSLTGLGAQFADEYAGLTRDLSSLQSRLCEFAEAPNDAPMRELIRLRLAGSRVAVDATRMESSLRGGAGYAASSATNRRFREAAFLPIQSPSEGQLRWELSQYE